MKSFSQCGQDRFVFAVSGEKTNGTFLDIGCNDASFHSNSFGLEQIGWSGLLVDIAPFASASRSSPFIQADARMPCEAIKKFAQSNNGFIDYLSLDVDDSTLLAFRALPSLSFGVMTIEHDLYRVGDASKKEIMSRLLDEGYDLVCENVIADGYGECEDWFVLDSYADKKIRDRYRCRSKPGNEIV